MVGVLVLIAAASVSAQVETIVWQGQEWKMQDFNTFEIGSATVEDGNLHVLADGRDIWNRADAFRFVYVEVEGDFTATVRLDEVPDTHGWSKTGIMVRAAATGDAANVNIVATRDYNVVMQERPVANEFSHRITRNQRWENGMTGYFRLVRSGTTITGYLSVDGETWIELGKTASALPETVLVGMAVSSHIDGVLGRAVFSDWQLTQ